MICSSRSIPNIKHFLLDIFEIWNKNRILNQLSKCLIRNWIVHLLYGLTMIYAWNSTYTLYVHKKNPLIHMAELN